MLYIFLGADTFSRREALQQLRSDLDQDGVLVTNTLVLDALQATPDEVIAACNALPFLGSHRLVILEGLLQAGNPRRRSRERATPKPEIPGATAGEAPDDASDEYEGPCRVLIQAIDQMPETTTLLLIDDKASDERLLAALRRKGTIERFEPLDQKSVPAWIQRRAQERGLKLDAATARLMADAVGPDTWMLANEIDKLEAYANGQIVREADARTLVSRVRERQGYLLADATAERRQQQALKLLHELEMQGDSLQALLSTIAGRYRRMAVAREMLDAGDSDSKIGRQLGAKGYGLQRLIEQTGRWTLEMLRNAMIRIAQADEDIKSGTYDEQPSLELLIHDLTVGRPARAA